MKQCIKCKKLKSKSEFSKSCKNKDGLECYCKECMRAYARAQYKKKVKGLKTNYRYEECNRVVDGLKQKLCKRCKRWKTESQYYKYRRHKDGFSEWCKECANKATNKARKNRLAIHN